MIPWYYEIQILFSIIYTASYEVQLEETVIFFTEHSMKLYAVIDGAGEFFPSFLLHFSPPSNNAFYLASLSASLCCRFSSY